MNPSSDIIPSDRSLRSYIFLSARLLKLSYKRGCLMGPKIKTSIGDFTEEEFVKRCNEGSFPKNLIAERYLNLQNGY